MIQPRHPRGTSAGGRFAATVRPEASGTLSVVDPETPTPRQVRDRIVAAHPGVRMTLEDAGEFVVVSRIVVDSPNEGTGSAVMEDLVIEADRHGWQLALTPTGDFGGSKTRLEKFYRRFGFVPNRGANKDFGTREAMLRPPAG